MSYYQEARVELKSAVKNKTGTILRLNKKNFEELSHELFLTTRQTNKKCLC